MEILWVSMQWPLSLFVSTMLREKKIKFQLLLLYAPGNGSDEMLMFMKQFYLRNKYVSFFNILMSEHFLFVCFACC